MSNDASAMLAEPPRRPRAVDTLRRLRHRIEQHADVARPIRREPVAWVAHAGLSPRGPARTPTRTEIETAMAMGVSEVEIDVCATADGHLIVRHTPWLPSRLAIASLTLDELQRQDPSTRTLDDIADQIHGRAGLLLDLKDATSTGALSTWLRQRPDHVEATVCSKDAVALATLRCEVPDVPRLLSLPNVSGTPRECVAQVLAVLVRNRRDGGLARLWPDVARAVKQATRHPRVGIAQLGAVPWSHEFPEELGRLTALVGASGISIHQWLVTPQLCTAAKRLGLEVTAWTVNNPADARRLIDCGVDRITSDRPAYVREGVRRLDIAEGQGARPRLVTPRLATPEPPRPGRELA